ncbi:hypothetical protein PO909_020285, partial [Leuciscus waleckii]
PLVTSASLSLDYKITARNKNGGLLEVLGRESMSLFGSSTANTVTLLFKNCNIESKNMTKTEYKDINEAPEETNGGLERTIISTFLYF